MSRDISDDPAIAAPIPLPIPSPTEPTPPVMRPEEEDEEEDSERRRGVVVVERTREVLFTKWIDIRPEHLPQREMGAIVGRRPAGEDDAEELV